MPYVADIVRRLDQQQQSRPCLALPFAVIRKYRDDRGSRLSALIAYYAFLSLFPMLLLLTTLLGYLLESKPHATQRLLRSALTDFPSIGDQLSHTLHPLTGSPVGLIVGVLGLTWGALGISRAIQYSMDEIWNVPGFTRPGLALRIGRGALLLGALYASFASTAAAAWLAHVTGFRTTALFVVPIVTSINVALTFVAFRVTSPSAIANAALYPGAVTAGVAWTVLQTVGGYLVASRLRHASAVYGFFGSILGALSWLYLAAQIGVYSGEINVVRALRLWPRSILSAPLTSADRRTLTAIAHQEQRVEQESVDVRFTTAEHSSQPGRRSARYHRSGPAAEGR